MFLRRKKAVKASDAHARLAAGISALAGMQRPDGPCRDAERERGDRRLGEIGRAGAVRLDDRPKEADGERP